LEAQEIGSISSFSDLRRDVLRGRIELLRHYSLPLLQNVKEQGAGLPRHGFDRGGTSLLIAQYHVLTIMHAKLFNIFARRLPGQV